MNCPSRALAYGDKTVGHIYNPTYTIAKPANAEQYAKATRRNGQTESMVRWTNKQGKKQTGELLPSGRVRRQSPYYSIQYRDGSGCIRRKATRCRDRAAAMHVLAQHDKRATQVRAGVLTTAEDAVADHLCSPIAEHVAAYLADLARKRGKGSKPTVAKRHVQNLKANLAGIIADCGFVDLRSINRRSVEAWGQQQVEIGRIANRTINGYVKALSAMCNWCVSRGRLVASPLNRPPLLDERATARRKRRAFVDEELQRLFWAARWRPLAERGRLTIQRSESEGSGKRSNWTYELLTNSTLAAAIDRARERLADQPNEVAALEQRGRRRALIYKALAFTGLRMNELASLTIGDLNSQERPEWVTLGATADKSGRGADVPLPDGLAFDIVQMLAERHEAMRREVWAAGGPMPARLPNHASLFNVPTGLGRILNKDLAAAGIPKRDDRGHTVDVHALRHTFGTRLSVHEVSPRIAQAAMRHSTIDMTMNTYTDLRLLDVAGAVNRVPDIPLDSPPNADRQTATGTDDASGLCAALALNLDQTRQSGATSGNTAVRDILATLGVTSDGDGLHSAPSDQSGKRVKGIEPSTFSLGS
jgi:integrase